MRYMEQVRLPLSRLCQITVICSVEQRVELLRHGLRERVSSTREKAVYMLQTWLDDTCSADVVKLLEYLDIQSHEGL